MFSKDVLIYQLCGGSISRIRAMVGGYNFTEIKDGISFNFKLCRKSNLVVIKYNEGKDLYSMEFLKLNKLGVKSVELYTDIYGDNIKNVFESFTGLNLTLQ